MNGGGLAPGRWHRVAVALAFLALCATGCAGGGGSAGVDGAVAAEDAADIRPPSDSQGAEDRSEHLDARKRDAPDEGRDSVVPADTGTDVSDSSDGGARDASDGAVADARDVPGDDIADGKGSDQTAPDQRDGAGAGDTAVSLGCEEPCWCGADTDFDPCNVYFYPKQIEWVTEATYAPPPTVPLEPQLILIRGAWKDFFTEGPWWCVNGEACGGHCIPSAYKVYVLDTQTDTVTLVAEEPLGSWPAGMPDLVPPWTIHGYFLEAPQLGKTYRFETMVIPGMPCACMDCLDDHARCAVDVQPPDRPHFCIDFPLVLGSSAEERRILPQSAGFRPAASGPPGSPR